MVWEGIVQSLAPLVGGAGVLVVYRRRVEPDRERDWSEPIGTNGVRLALLFAVFLWLMPAGALVALPALLVLSVLSPAARADWRAHRTPRLMAMSVALMCLTATGFLAVDEPISPEAWGTPLFTENPEAPLFPASEQYTWFTGDLVILQSISMRLPHQAGLTWAEGAAFGIASLLDMETSRMHQAIGLLDEEVPFVRLNPDDILLDPAPSPATVDIRLESNQKVSIEFRRYDVKTTAFGVDPGGQTVGEVVTFAQATWGGQLDMLVIVRPLTHPTLDTDSIGEQWVRPWLAEHAAVRSAQ